MIGRVLAAIRRIKWRKLFRAVHRDLGYIAVSLVIAYGVSGIVVNHIDDWDPDYSYADRAINTGPLPSGTLAQQEAYVIGQLGIPTSLVRGHFLETEHVLRVYLDKGQEVKLDRRTGRGVYKELSRRPVIYEVNALHLNKLKGIWTYVADAFAIALIVLALTGLTMMKGDRGITGRGKWFVGAGLLVPVGFIIYMYS
ncbi:MAG TPA: PepSY-associated TM helix domain-containing protein [Kofleriaceae bacterium]